jgi:hypothetical protein
MENGESRRDLRETKGELSLDILKDIVGGNGPLAEKRPDGQAVAAMTIEPQPVVLQATSATDATGGSQAGKGSTPLNQVIEYHADSFDSPVRVVKTSGTFGSALGPESPRPLPPTPDSLALKGAEKGDPAWERTITEWGQQKQTSAATPEKLPSPAEKSTQPVKSFDVIKKYTLHDTGDRTIARSDDGKNELKWRSTTTFSFGGGINDKDDKINPLGKVSLENTTTINGKLQVTENTQATGQGQVKSELGLTGDIRKGEGKIKAGVEATAELALEHVTDDGDNTQRSKALAYARAAAEASAALSVANMSGKVKAELGAMVGVAASHTQTSGEHSAMGQAGVEFGAGAAASASGSFSDGKLNLSFSAKFAAGLGLSLKGDLTYDVMEVPKTWTALLIEAQNPDSLLFAALTKTTTSEQVEQVYREFHKNQLTNLVENRGAFFGALAAGALHGTSTYEQVLQKTGDPKAAFAAAHREALAEALVSGTEALGKGNPAWLAAQATKHIARLLS